MLIQAFKPHSDEYWRAEQLNGTFVILVERSAAPFPSPQAVEGGFSPLLRSLDQLDRSKYDLLIDLRSVAGRNDPDFERVIEPGRVRLQQGFRRIAVLVNSVVGQLQVQRHANQDRAVLRTFLDRAKALEWLAS